jgi:hypothetical protein
MISIRVAGLTIATFGAVTAGVAPWAAAAPSGAAFDQAATRTASDDQ